MYLSVYAHCRVYMSILAVYNVQCIYMTDAPRVLHFSALPLEYQNKGLLTRDEQSHQPIVEMKKRDVEEKRFGAYVVMPDGNGFECMVEVVHSFGHNCESQISTWKNISFGQNHCHAGFLQFVDLNSQPNGRSADSSGPTYYFIPTIQSPKVGIANYL